MSRLAEIKSNIEYNRFGSKIILTESEYNYLIQQAERVEELEETIADYAYEIGKRKRAINKKNEQNKRYREALEFYANRDNYKLEHFDPNIDDYMSTVDYDEGQKARKALKGEDYNE